MSDWIKGRQYSNSLICSNSGGLLLIHLILIMTGTTQSFQSFSCYPPLPKICHSKSIPTILPYESPNPFGSTLSDCMRKTASFFDLSSQEGTNLKRAQKVRNCTNKAFLMKTRRSISPKNKPNLNILHSEGVFPSSNEGNEKERSNETLNLVDHDCESGSGSGSVSVSLSLSECKRESTDEEDKGERFRDLNSETMLNLHRIQDSEDEFKLSPKETVDVRTKKEIEMIEECAKEQKKSLLDDKKLFFFCGHDGTLLSLGNAFKFGIGSSKELSIPQYATCMIFEIWKSHKPLKIHKDYARYKKLRKIHFASGRYRREKIDKNKDMEELYSFSDGDLLNSKKPMHKDGRICRTRYLIMKKFGNKKYYFVRVLYDNSKWKINGDTSKVDVAKLKDMEHNINKFRKIQDFQDLDFSSFNIK